MNYNISFQDISLQLIWNKLRTTKFLSLVYSVIKPLQDLNTNVSYSVYSAASTYAVGDTVKYNNINYFCRIAIAVPESFDDTKWASLGQINDLNTLTDNINTFLAFNSHQIYLTKFLNDKYDSVQRRITLETLDLTTNYLYNLSEGADPVYMYNNWSSTTAYVIDDRVVYTDNYIYVCIQAHTNKTPGDVAYWTKEDEISYYYQKGGTASGYGFTVYVPTGLLGTSEPQFIADVNKYKYGGITWEIVNI